MISGVYWLEFAEGVIYIGKAQDIDARWKQHARAFEKGTAAKNMQQAYLRYGLPNANVLQFCHTDHIDIIEAYHIYKYRPVLNTVYPTNTISEEDYEVLSTANFLETSTVQHCQELVRKYEMLLEFEASNEELESRVLELSQLRDKEEVETDAYAKARLQIAKLEELQAQEQYDLATAYQTKINKLLNRSLWQRIFNEQHL